VAGCSTILHLFARDGFVEAGGTPTGKFRLFGLREGKKTGSRRGGEGERVVMFAQDHQINTFDFFL
jgi:hypothetical protein